MPRLLHHGPFASALYVATLLYGSAAAQVAAQASIPVAVTAVTSPPSLIFSWPFDSTATGYQISRRLPGASGWSVPTTVPGAGSATGWTDTTVVTGTRYEYQLNKLGSPAARMLLTAGVAASAIEDRGICVLLVDATLVAGLGARLDRLQQDLLGDGWRVRRHDVQPTDSVPSVKARITAEVAANPGLVRSVFLLGHVPVPYSGSITPDGHVPDHSGAWPADVYYGELTSAWTDVSVNTTVAARPQNRNVPGDGKFDQSSIPSDIELEVGRVDFHDLPSFPASALQLTAAYLDKDHDYRHKVFAVDQRAVIDDNFGWFGGEAFAASGWRNFTALVGAANVQNGDYFGTLNVPSGGGHAWSYGCGGGWFAGAGGVGSTTDFVTSQNRGVFTMLFGSYFGDWDSTDNFLRAALAQGWTLSNAWAGRPHWSFHPMGLGGTLGASARLSQNDTTAGGFGGRSIHVALMGDPTLRQHVIAPASALVVTDAWPQANLSWTGSSDPVAGYHVYRSNDVGKQFVRLTTAPVASTQWTDPQALAGSSTYLVRAVRLETTPTGSYWNLAQGAFASVVLPTQAAAHTNYGAGCHGLQLAASPAPVSTPVAGTLVTYSISGIPETAPGSGTRFGVTIVSLGGDPLGAPLDGLGAPGCRLFVTGLDNVTMFLGSAAVQTTTFTIPAGVTPGTQLYATAAAFVQPGTLNAYGVATSNGTASFINLQ
ncbi:MAG: fibronectin type III domain-containing protein [Planctomycetes bacterium]|jgi:hypothetical protein|nr:fibronectin type III domain-containing protein [Planctomycetota bacterium]